METGETNSDVAEIPTDAIILTNEEIEGLPVVHIPRNVTKSPSLKQFQLLRRHDRRRLITILSRGRSFNVTHFCSHCHKCVFLSWKKTSYDSNKAEYHLTNLCNESGKNSIRQRLSYIEVRAEREHNNLLTLQRENSVLMGQQELAPVVQRNTIRNYTGSATYEHIALHAQCHYFLYAQTASPFSQFADKHFRNMLKSMIPVGPGYMMIKKAPVLTIAKLKQYINAEYALFIENLRELLIPLVKQSAGRPFATLLHDAVMLANKMKFLSIALQVIDDEWQMNHVIALSFGRIISNSASHLVAKIKKVLYDLTNYTVDQIIATSMQDIAALKVAKDLEVDMGRCLMHEGDKIGKSCVGELLRSRNHVIVNPFPQGLALLKKYRDQTKFLSSSYSNRVKYDNFKLANPDAVSKMLVLDTNETRVTSIYELIKSNLYVKMPMSKFFLEDDIPPFLSADNWEEGIEFEAVLHIQQRLTTLAQNEQKCNGAMGAVIKQHTLKTLKAPGINVIDMDRWSIYKKPQRIRKSVFEMTEVGKICRNRAILECERRFFGNNTEEIYDECDDEVAKKVQLTDREKGMLLLDPRTCMQQSIMDEEAWREAYDIVQDEYVELYYAKMIEKRAEISTLDDVVSATETDDDDDLNPPVAVAAQRLSLNLGQSTEARYALAMENNNNQELTEQDYRQIDERDAKSEFILAFQHWQNWIPDWKHLFPGYNFETYDLMDEMLHLDMKILMKESERVSESNDKKFKLLPLMAKCSKFQLGALVSQSFAERMNSAGKNIVTDNRTNLDQDMIDKLVILRMNKRFMEYARQERARKKQRTG